MTAESITNYITSLPHVETATSTGNTFFFVNLNPDAAAENKFPFATLVTSDDYDEASDLNREGVFRLNLGLSKLMFQSILPNAEATHDFTALNRVMPHPVYGLQYWICVLNPSDDTFDETVIPLITNAHKVALRRQGLTE